MGEGVKKNNLRLVFLTWGDGASVWIPFFCEKEHPASKLK